MLTLVFCTSPNSRMPNYYFVQIFCVCVYMRTCVHVRVYFHHIKEKSVAHWLSQMLDTALSELVSLCAEQSVFHNALTEASFYDILTCAWLVWIPLPSFTLLISFHGFPQRRAHRQTHPSQSLRFAFQTEEICSQNFHRFCFPGDSWKQNFRVTCRQNVPKGWI